MSIQQQSDHRIRDTIRIVPCSSLSQQRHTQGISSRVKTRAHRQSDW